MQVSTTWDKEPTQECPFLVRASEARTNYQDLTIQVETKTILPEYAQKNSVVKRLHDDFVWLRKVLSENQKYEGVIIPPCPDDFQIFSFKHYFPPLSEVLTFDSDSDEYEIFLEDHKEQNISQLRKTLYWHDKFLVRIGENRIFWTDPMLIKFLSSEEALNKNTGVMDSITSVFKLIKRTFEEKIAVPMSFLKENDKYFEETTNHVNSYIPILKQCLDSVEKMIQSSNVVVYKLKKLSDSLGFLALKETTKQGTILKSLNGILTRVRTIESKIAAEEDLTLETIVRNNYNSYEAIKELLTRRMKVLVEREKSLLALKKETASNHNIVSIKETCSQLERRFSGISESGHKEIDRMKSELNEDTKLCLASYCEHGIKNYEDSYKAYEESISDFEAILN